jgi:hypothetical protein
MARIRTIKPEFPQSESMGRVSRDARLCFIMLWTIADDAGRLRGNSRMLASLLYPYDDDAKKLMDKWLAELEREHCIARYAVNGDSYVSICGWLDHQKIDRPSPSKIPAPPEPSRVLANPREPSPPDQGGEGTKEGTKEGSAEQASPPAFTIPLIDKTEHRITQAEVDEWAAAYPAVNVPQQIREMRAWSSANPSQRKTARGVNAFIVRWLAREQDKGGKPSSVIGVTVPGPTGPDPALLKIEQDSKRAAPPSLETLARMAELRKPVQQGAH